MTTKKTEEKTTVVLYARAVKPANHAWALKQAKKAGLSLTAYVDQLLTTQRNANRRK